MALQKTDFSMMLSIHLVLLVFLKQITLQKDFVLTNLYNFQPFVTKDVLSLRVS